MITSKDAASTAPAPADKSVRPVPAGVTMPKPRPLAVVGWGVFVAALLFGVAVFAVILVTL